MIDQTSNIPKPSQFANRQPARPSSGLLRRLADALKAIFAESDPHAAARRAHADDGVFQPRKY